MTIITPAGKMNFDWSPKDKETLTKLASSGAVVKSDKDILFDAAKKVVKAQFDMGNMGNPGEVEDTVIKDEICPEGNPCDKVEEVIPSATDDAGAPKVSGDAVAAVQDLAEKAEAAEAVAGKVQEAVEKVEEAVQGVKDAVGAVKEEEVELEVEIEDEEKDEKKGDKPDFGKKDDADKDEKDDKDDKDDKDEGEKDDIIKESIEACASARDVKTASSDELVKTSKISPTTRKKIVTFWKDYLGYDPQYVKLMATDFEK